MSLLIGKRALIVGVLNQHSLAYAIASSLQKAGADIALSYHNEDKKERMAHLAQSLQASFYEPCNVTQDDSIEAFFTRLNHHWQHFDILVHSVASAPKEALMDDYLTHTNRQAFLAAHDISSYSFTALAHHAKAMLRPKGALLTLTYLGSERAIKHYNVMGVAKASLEASMRYIAQSLGPLGVRVNAISAGPIRTVASSGIKNFTELATAHEEQALLKEPLTPQMVGNTAACLCSDWMSGVTGEIIHVDNGVHIAGLLK